MTCEQLLKALTPAQRRLFDELSEPMKPNQDAWFFPERNRRTLECLAKCGLAEHVESDMRRHGYKLTPLGMMCNGPIVSEPA